MEMYERHRLQASGLQSTHLPAALDVLGVLGLVTLGAFVRIPLPFSPVPATLQTFFVLACPFLVGPGRSTAALGLYAALGMAGIPLFAAAPATLGYVGAFLLVPWVSTRFRRPIAGMLTATGLIYLLGAAWLVVGLRMSPAQGLALGVLPFLPGDAVKLLGAWRLVRWLR